MLSLFRRPPQNCSSNWKSPIFKQAWIGPKLERGTKALFCCSQVNSEPESPVFKKPESKARWWPWSLSLFQLNYLNLQKALGLDKVKDETGSSITQRLRRMMSLSKHFYHASIARDRHKIPVATQSLEKLGSFQLKLISRLGISSKFCPPKIRTFVIF